MGDTVNTNLLINEDYLERYYKLNMKKKEIEKELNYLKKTFHDYLDLEIGKQNKGEITKGKYTLQRQIRTSTNYIEDKTIEKLEQLQLEDCIIITKRPNTDKIEAAIKLGLIKEQDFKDCKQEKHTQALIIKVD